MSLSTFLLISAVLLIFFKIFVFLTTGYNKNFVCLNGKTVIVTGANSGIGFATALEMAKRGARVVLACRNRIEGERAAKRIVAETNNANVIFKRLDLASFKSIRNFASEMNASERVDVLINNAAAALLGGAQTEDGHQVTMQTNYFGPFMLTHLLLDNLKRSPSGRIINVSSIMAAFLPSIDVDGIDNFPSLPSRVFGEILLYARSKLCGVYSTIALGKRLKGTNVTVNSLNPGVVNTNIFRNYAYPFGLLNYLFVRWMCKTSEEGAQTTIYLATAKEVEDKTGGFYVDCKECSHYWNVREKDADAIYEKTMEILRVDEIIT